VNGLAADPMSPETSRRLPAGWVRVDCHLHTVRSGDAVTTLEQLAQRVEHTGLDVVCITDHHAIDAATEALRLDLGVRVVVGEEIRTPAGELIGLFLTERIPYVLPVDEVVARIRFQGGVVYAPHPFDPVRAGLREATLRRLCASGDLDVIEAFNAKIEDDAHNRAAKAVASAYGLPVAAGSDAHDPPGVGAAWVEMPDFDGPNDFIRALAQGRLVGEHRPHAPRFAPAARAG
jgi:predicted metal-dependent phosphoesterase TrpH